MTHFVGIGVGPGDSELLTLKAVQTLKQLDTLYVPHAHSGQVSLAETIAQPYLKTTIEIKSRRFPMVRSQTVKAQEWQKIADEIIADVNAGQEVGFLTLGDPAIYSTFSYLCNYLQGKIPIRSVAGISSFSQIASILVQPLILDNESLAIIPANKDPQQLEQLIDLNDNLVLMKLAVNFAKIYQILAQRNLLAQTTVIERASMEQQVIKTMNQYHPEDKVPYFTTAVLRKEHTDAIQKNT